MQHELLKERLGDLIHECTYENFKIGYDPMSDIIMDEEYKTDLDPITQEKEYEEYDERQIDILCSEFEEEELSWRARCSSRREMAPDLYERYFSPFFNSTLKDVYENCLTEELKFYKPSFQEWVFMILAVMTEYYFREKYPNGNEKLSFFNLELNRKSVYYEYELYESIPW